jgi:cardiolipin synthase (CMP-forming)
VTLRCKPRQSAYVYVCLIPRLLRALHLDIFEQPVQNGVFQQAVRKGEVAFGVFMNIPNLLTMSRIILVPIIVILLMDGSFCIALVLLVISGVTDVLDGFLARVLNQQTVLGAYLDPIADKALMISCFVTLSVKKFIPGWLSVIVISRDCIILLGVSVLTMLSVPFKVKPVLLSKLTTLIQIVTILAVLMGRCWSANRGIGLDALFLLTALLTVVSGFYYMALGIKYINRASQPPINGD